MLVSLVLVRSKSSELRASRGVRVSMSRCSFSVVSVSRLFWVLHVEKS